MEASRRDVVFGDDGVLEEWLDGNGMAEILETTGPRHTGSARAMRGRGKLCA